MGSSDTGTGGGGAVDCSIGSIVWVRRRNGSWWPGKILGPDELSASHVMSPRSGTPVKLLGREDASVDWYNLEKSKRVKAFRCGEFDDCIERAEASQGMPPKKREKYARREDAILHALELEKQTFEKKYGKVDFSTNSSVHSKSPNGVREELMMPSENLEIGKGRHSQSETCLDSKIIRTSLMDKGKDQSIFPQRLKEESEFCMDDGTSGVTPRMRDLGDFGLQIVPSSLKISPSASPNASHKPLLGSGGKTHPNNALDPEDVVDGTGNLSEKRKRPEESFGDDVLAKRRERRLPLVQVLENSSKAPGPLTEADSTVNLSLISEDEQPGSGRYISLQHGGLEEDNVGSTEDTETDSSETDSLDSDTDELASLSEGAVSIELQPKYPRRSEAREEQSISSEELDELTVETEISHPGYNDPASNMGMSQWQLKGKRNTRSLVKKPIDGGDRNFSWVSMDEINAFERVANGRDEPYSLGKSYGPQVAKYGSRGLDGISSRTTQWQQWDWSNQHVRYWDDSPVYGGGRHDSGKSMWIDVDVRVQSSSSYQREHVPMISLRSKLNDQAIVGHPIQIEALEDGSTESLLVETDEWCAEVQENEAALAPTWRTARRTANFRVPRPNLSSAGEESYRNAQYIDGRRGCSGSLGHKGGALAHTPAAAVDRKSSRKPQKKISLSSNQKTRTLSSIASQPRKSSDPRRSGNEYGMDGLKPDSSLLPTTVACIPVKLVFSRLHEELVGRHP